jgi:Fe-S-cluster formation regulator IscX/YfhJ
MSTEVAENSLQLLCRARDLGYLASMRFTEMRVWLALLSRADYRTLEAWPSISTIGRDAGMDGRGVQRAIRRLQAIGMIVLINQSKGGRTNIWRVTCPQTPVMDTPVAATGVSANNPGICDTPTPVSVTGEPRYPAPPNPGRGDHPNNRTPHRTPNGTPHTPRADDRDDDPSQKSGKSAEEIANEIYLAYPKHVEPKPAREQIQKTLKALAKRGTPNPSGWLLERVRQYASARKRVTEVDPAEARFTPACHRWLRNEKYDDDPAEWEPRSNGKSKNRNGAHNGHLAEHLVA